MVEEHEAKPSSSQERASPAARTRGAKASAPPARAKPARAKPADASKDVTQSDPAPLYLVKGSDPSLVAQSAKALLARLSRGSAGSLAVEEHVLGGSGETSIEAAIESCRTLPMFTERRIVVVRDIGRMSAADVSTVVRYLEDPSPSASLVLLSGSGPLPAGLSRSLARHGEVIDTAVGTGQAREAWLSQRLGEAPFQLDPRAAALVSEHLGDDLARLEGLLALLAGTYGEGSRLGPEQVRPYLTDPGGASPWELTDAIDEGQVTVALDRLRRMLSRPEGHPLAVMAILHRHVSAMLRLDGAQVSTSEDAAALLGVKSSFVAGKAMRQSRRLGHDRIAAAIELLADADLDLRGNSGLTGQAVMEVLVARLAQLARRSHRAPPRHRTARAAVSR